MGLLDKVGSAVSSVGYKVARGVVDANRFVQNNIVDPFVGWVSGQSDRDYNAEQAELDRAFQAAQADLSWQRNVTSAREAMDFESREAQKNRDWQEKMDNTRYSRAMADLLEAGVNPLMAVTGGLSASTPSGSSARSSTAQALPASGSSARSSSSGNAASILGILANTAIALMSKGKVKKK